MCNVKIHLRFSNAYLFLLEFKLHLCLANYEMLTGVPYLVLIL